jgi:protocatechuate 3,4-dioxygenase, beta subunit
MMKRRQFSQSLLAMASAYCLSPRLMGSDGLPLTPKQTKGPFYPIPEIERQEHFDFDLTRKGSDSPIAEGEVIVIRGTVVGIDDRPLDKVFVEVWQACHSGRYNHPSDKNTSPMDPNFQYWGRLQTSADGAYSFKTIQPGKYPGRTPHIHFRVVAAQREVLETQLYFEANGELNVKDGVYKGVSKEQQKSVTTGLEKVAVDAKNPNSERLPTGNFKIVLGPTKDTKSTPGM